jgi:ankyrin repeat protein
VDGVPKLNPARWWEDQEEAVMSTCSSLVVIIGHGDSRIAQFSHFSVKEFLTSDRLAESSGDVSSYHIPLELAHMTLAQACLRVLLQLDDRVDREKIKDFPLAIYAAEHWVEHAGVENVSSHIEDEMECLFDANKPHFAAWLWIYNKDSYGSSMTTMSPKKPAAEPLYYAALFGFRYLTAHLLAEHPDDVRAEGGREATPLHASAFHGHADIFSLLIDHFPNPDIQGYFYQTPLYRSSFGGHLEIGRRLLDRGANVNASDATDWTPLYIAATTGQLEFVRMLLDHGAAINSPDSAGRTPLHMASKFGYSTGLEEVVKNLKGRACQVSEGHGGANSKFEASHSAHSPDDTLQYPGAS